MKRHLTLSDERYDIEFTHQTDTNWELTRDGITRRVELLGQGTDWILLTIDGKRHCLRVTVDNKGNREVSEGCCRFTIRDLARDEFDPGSPGGSSGTVSDNIIRTPLPGKLLRLEVAPGDTVAAGATVAVIESMKMENVVKSPRDGVVQSVHAEPGTMVDGGIPLVILATAGEIEVDK